MTLLVSSARFAIQIAELFLDHINLSVHLITSSDHTGTLPQHSDTDAKVRSVESYFQALARANILEEAADVGKTFAYGFVVGNQSYPVEYPEYAYEDSAELFTKFGNYLASVVDINDSTLLPALGPLFVQFIENEKK